MTALRGTAASHQNFMKSAVFYDYPFHPLEDTSYVSNASEVEIKTFISNRLSIYMLTNFGAACWFWFFEDCRILSAKSVTKPIMLSHTLTIILDDSFRFSCSTITMIVSLM